MARWDSHRYLKAFDKLYPGSELGTIILCWSLRHCVASVHDWALETTEVEGLVFVMVRGEKDTIVVVGDLY